MRSIEAVRRRSRPGGADKANMMEEHAMSARTVPPFRADHVGSLLRPRELLQAREDHREARISAAELKAIEDRAIREAVKIQEDIGLRSVTDGEFRRGSWHMDFLYRVGGVTKVTDSLKIQFRNENGVIEFTPAALRVTGKLRLEQCIFGEAFKFLQSI